MKVMKCITLVFLVILIFPVSSSLAGQDVIKFSFSQITPAAHPYYSAISEPWAREIEERSGGRVKITLYPAGTLAHGNVMYSSIIDGITDIGTSSFGWEAGRHPVMESLVFVPGFQSADVACKVINEAYQKFKLKELADTHVLFLHACAPMHIWSKTPIREKEDMAGMEIRAAGPTGKIAKCLGGVPVSAPQGQVYEMLSKGVVKASISSLDVLKGFRQAEVVKYVTLAYFHVAPFFVSMNLEKWEGLPPDIRKIFDETSAKYVGIAGKVWDKASENGLAYAKESGLDILTLSPGERSSWHACYTPLRQEYLDGIEAKGLPGKAFLDEVTGLMKKYQAE